MIAYKVMLSRNGRLYSWTSDSTYLTPGGNIRYTKSKVNRPKPGFGPLCAFRTLQAARSFDERSRFSGLSYEIWEVEVEPSTERFVWEVDENGRTLYGCRVRLDALPEGTVLCDSITLKRRIA